MTSRARCSHTRRPSRVSRMLADPQGEAADLLTIAQIAYDAGEMELVQLLDAAGRAP
jgi:hypothetical protein